MPTTSLKNISIIFTGGTISMKMDPDTHSVVPALKPQEIIAGLTGIETIAHIKIIHFGDIAGPQMTCERMYELAKVVIDELENQETDGIVITHGTDTLEETAFFLELTTYSVKPIVVVGAMRNASELGYDGSANLSAAVITAVADASRGQGVLVVLNNEINAASEVVKLDTVALDTFKSPAFGPLGVIDNDKALYYRSSTSNQYVGLYPVDKNVPILKTYAGMSGKLIHACIEMKVDGIIIEAMGRGNVPPEVAQSIHLAIQSNIPVVICSRCITGRVLDTYGYEGAGRHLKNLGAIFGGDLPGNKARIKLILALGFTDDMERIKELFESGLYE